MDHSRPGTICHPGEILKQDFMDPMGMSVDALARALDMPRVFIGDIIRGQRGITADIATRLGHYFKGTGDSWMRLQKLHDAVSARHNG